MGPGRNPKDRFSHNEAHFIFIISLAQRSVSYNHVNAPMQYTAIFMAVKIDNVKFICKPCGFLSYFCLKGGGSICAHASIFLKFCMVNTFDVSTIKMHLFISIETFRSQESTLSYSNFSMTPA